MTVYLDVDRVIELHALAGEDVPLLDRATLEGAVARCRAGFGDEDAFPRLVDKAAALLHGIASTQCFQDGNKRAAWLATVVFLELNGVQLPDVADIEAEAFVMAVAVTAWPDTTVEKAAEWLQGQAERASVQRHDPRVEFAFLAKAATEQEGAFNALGATFATAHTSALPSAWPLTFVARIQWTREDVGTPKQLTLIVQPEGGGPPVLGGVAQWEVHAPVQGGHSHHPDGLMPSLVLEPLLPLFEQEGRYEVTLRVDGHLLARVPFNFIVL